MAVEPGDAIFQSQLDEMGRMRAREELNELNDKDRELAVQSFRQWVLQQKWLKTPTDFEFLLRFLRARKFSQLLARETLENYWHVKTTSPEWFRNVDPADKTIQEILRTGAFLCPKVYDRQGRRVYIESVGKLNMDVVKKKWGVDNLFKTIGLVCDWINKDETVQVNGLLVLTDNTAITMSHVMTIWNADYGKRMMQFYQNSLPCRMKGLHMYNEPTFFDAIYAMFSPFMKQKIKDRMHLHGRSMVSVYQHIDQHLFPDEYLPDDCENKTVGSTTALVEEMIADMNSPEFRSYVMNLSSDKYGVDLKTRAKDKGSEVPEASFRKVNLN